MERKTDDSEREVQITIVDVLDYVGESVRPIKEGYAVFAANHIVCIGWRKCDTEWIDILAYVTQSSHPGQTPHTVNMRIYSDISQWALKCSCKAGTSKCKHIVACLLHAEKYRKLVYMSCTEVTQVWGTPKAHKSAPWGANKVSEMCCFKRPRTSPEVDEHDEEAILVESFSRILAVSKQSALYKHIQGRFLNDPLSYPNRAQQALDNTDDEFCVPKDIELCLLRKIGGIEVHPASYCSDEEKIYYEKPEYKCLEDPSGIKNNSQFLLLSLHVYQ
ncbi:uncharacterized protein LOC135705104 [Ochlerotatus camptorhynchus]|uniref:uncharacterized protein LOC135705104 n=1 Tax=Ochlerotatus camptorhynchus TaxID=644619 RepID=UPI0031DE82AF